MKWNVGLDEECKVRMEIINWMESLLVIKVSVMYILMEESELVTHSVIYRLILSKLGNSICYSLSAYSDEVLLYLKSQN